MHAKNRAAATTYVVGKISSRKPETQRRNRPATGYGFVLTRNLLTMVLICTKSTTFMLHMAAAKKGRPSNKIKAFCSETWKRNQPRSHNGACTTKPRSKLQRPKQEEGGGFYTKRHSKPPCQHRHDSFPSRGGKNYATACTAF